MAKAKKSKAKKTKAKKAKKAKVKKVAKKTKAAAAKRPAKKAKKKAPARKAAPKKVAKKATPAKKKKQTVGEGDYAASRSFDKAQSSFVKRNESKIPAMGKAAEKALEGPEGASLLAAEAEAKSHSKGEGSE